MFLDKKLLVARAPHHLAHVNYMYDKKLPDTKIVNIISVAILSCTMRWDVKNKRRKQKTGKRRQAPQEEGEKEKQGKQEKKTCVTNDYPRQMRPHLPNGVD